MLKFRLLRPHFDKLVESYAVYGIVKKEICPAEQLARHII